MRTSDNSEPRTGQPTEKIRLFHRPFTIRRRKPSQCEDGGIDSGDVKPSAIAPAHNGQERSDHDSNNQLLLPRYYRSRNRQFSSDTCTDRRSTMASPRRIRLTKGFEDLKIQEPQRTKLPMPKQHSSSPSSPVKLSPNHKTQQGQSELIKENDAPAYRASRNQPATHSSFHAAAGTNSSKRPKDTRSKLPVASPSGRRKVQVEKMVHFAKPPKHPQRVARISAVPSPVSNPKRRAILTAPADGRPQVETAMPEAYWLGRFMTLTNAFHYEDSFNEPDIATGFEMPSSYSRPFRGSDDGNMAGYRVKRAFMVLENLCVTDEASMSLRAFRDAYTSQVGDEWMD